MNPTMLRIRRSTLPAPAETGAPRLGAPRASHTRVRAVLLAGAGALLGGCFDPTEVGDTETDTGTMSDGATEVDPTLTGGATPGMTADDTTGSAPTTDPSTTDAPTTEPPAESSTGTCEGAGCPCGAPEDCGDGFACGPEGTCVAAECGNGTPEPGEDCDDGDRDDGDGCDADCSYTEVVIDVSYQTTCAWIEGGRVRCWGNNNQGQLGYGNTDLVGDDETPADAGDVELPGPVLNVSSGDVHSCAMLESGTQFLCWGGGGQGQLGYGNTQNIGDDEFPSAIGPVDIGADVELITIGGSHSCAITVSGTVRCWGSGGGGALGYGNPNNIGDNELPSAAGNVMIGAAIDGVSAGIGHTCAIQSNGALRCWGQGFNGQLGYGNTNTIGDDETPSAAAGAPLAFPTAAVQVGAGLNHTCALFESGDVRCWGLGNLGQLGRGDVLSIGDDESATTIDPIPLGAPAVAIAVGDDHTCALLEDGAFRCWGSNFSGELGLGTATHLGDDEAVLGADPVDLDGEVIQFDCGGVNTCVVLDDYRVRCWGNNNFGQLGLGNTDNVGDDELPIAAPVVPVL
jgi:cysteine-rich repeat protein